MKNLLACFILYIGVFNANAQDTLITKNGNVLSVKIVHVDESTVYFYQPLDQFKQIRAASKKSLRTYKYISIENGANRSVVESDSILFSKYLVDSRNSALQSKIDADNNSFIKRTSKGIKFKPPISVNRHFNRAGNDLIAAGLFLFLGSIIQMHNNNREIDIYNATAIELEYFEQNGKYLTGLSYGCFAMSGLLVFSAGIDIRNGALKLK